MATLGYTSIGATTGTTTVTSGSQFPVFCRFTATEYGLMDSISFYANALSGTANMRAAIWASGNSAGNPLIQLITQDIGAQAVSTTPSWITSPFSPVQLSAGTQYDLMFWGDVSFNYYYDAGTPGQQYQAALYTYPTLGSSDSGGATQNNLVSVYANYVPRTLTAYNYNQINRISSIQRARSIRI